MPHSTVRRLFPWVLFAAAAAALGTAYTAELVFGYEPCVLCLYQRVPYAVIAALGIAALVRPGMSGPLAMLAALTFAVGAGIAFYHVGVEQFWWAPVTPCGGGTEGVNSTADLMASLQQKPAKSCTDADWMLFGISMATYNAAVSAALAGLMFGVWRRLRGQEAA